MYQYYRKCHSTQLLLEEENKKLIDDWENLHFANLIRMGKLQDRLRLKKIKSETMKEKPTFGIAVDGWCSGNPGLCGYRGIDIETGEELFLQNHLGYGTNNVAEFLAIVHALGFAKKNNRSAVVYSDSEIAIGWINKKEVKSGLREVDNPELFKKIKKCEMFLLEQKRAIIIYKWQTKEWGEIPADFGRK